jgi:nitrite reductase/ring-hydroxylating ferredoxin subunit
MLEVASGASLWQVELTEVGVYERSLPVGLERIWENVLDWEHLPWLHRTSFAAIELEEASWDGWRARIGVDTAQGRATLRTEVALDRAALRYVTRTLDGPGKGTEISTRLIPEGARRTRIHVSFQLPPGDAERLASAGERLLRAYQRLWDEDEAMMVRRQAVLDARSRSAGAAARQHAVSLGGLEELRPRLPLVIEAFGVRVRVLTEGGSLLAHSTRCPHLGGPLEEAPVTNGCVVCPWHGYRFDLRTGCSADGRALALSPGLRVRVSEGSHEVLLERVVEPL